MTQDGAKRLNLAIKDCLRACYEAENPLAGMAAFLAGLRETGSWNDAEMEEIEHDVFHMLSLMVRRSYRGELETLIQDESPPLGKKYSA